MRGFLYYVFFVSGWWMMNDDERKPGYGATCRLFSVDWDVEENMSGADGCILSGAGLCKSAKIRHRSLSKQG